MGWQEDLNNDPEFRKLPYDKQTEVRYRIYSERLKKDPKFLNLPIMQREDIVRKLAFTLPSFENAGAEEELKSYLSMIKEMPEGKAKNDVRNKLFAYSALDESLITKGVVGGIIDPLHRMGVLNRGATPAGMKPKEYLFSRDLRKTRDYLAYLLDDGYKATKGARMAQTWGKLWGMGTDIAPTLMGSFGVSGAVSGKLANAGLKLGRGGQWMVQTLVPEMIEASVEGVLGTSMVILDKAARSELDDKKLELDLKTVARDFGSYAAMDYVMGLVVSGAVPFLKVAGYSLGKLKAPKVYGEMKPKQFESVMKSFVNGELDPSDIKRLPQIMQDHLATLDHIHRMEKTTDHLLSTPEDRVVYTAHNMGWNFLYEPESGTFRYHKKLQSGDTIKKAYSVQHANEKLSNILEHQINDLDPDQIDEWRIGREHLFKLMEDRNEFKNFVGGANEADLKNLDIDAEALESFKSRGSSFVKEGNRGAITRAEANAIEARASGAGYTVFRVDAVKTPDIEARLKKGRYPYEEIGGHNFTSGDNGLVIMKKPLMSVEDPNYQLLQKAHLAGKGVDRVELKLIEDGFDGAVLTKGNETIIRSFHPSRLKIVDDLVSPVTGRYAGVSSVLKGASKIAGEANTKVTVNAALDGVIGREEAMMSDEVVGTLIADAYLENDHGKLKEALELYMERFENPERGKTKVIISTSKYNDGDIWFTDAYEDKNPIIRISVDEALNPATLSQKKLGKVLGQMTDYGRYHSRYSRHFDEKMFTKYGEEVKKQKRVRETVKRKLFDTSNMDVDTKKTLLRNIVEGKMGKKEVRGKVVYRDADGKIVHPHDRTAPFFEIDFNGKHYMAKTALTADEALNDLIDQVMIDSMDASYIKHALALEGMKLVKSKKGGIKILRGNKIVAEGADVPSVLRDLDWAPKIDAAFGPKIAGFDESGDVRFKYDGNSVIGTKKEVLNFLSKFEDYRNVGRMKHMFKNVNGDIFKKVNGTFEVRHHGTKSVMEFNSMAEARKWIEGGWEELDSLKSMATKKGFDFYYRGGQYHAVGQDGTVAIMNKMDEVEKMMASYPDPTAAPELIPFLQELEEELTVLKVGKLNRDAPFWMTDIETSNKALKSDGEISAWRKLMTRVEPMDDWMRKVGRATGNHDLVKKYMKLEELYKLARVQQLEGKNVLHRIFAPDGKMTSKKKRIGITHYMESGTDANKLSAIAEEFDLTDRELGIVEKLRSFYGKSPDEGLYGTFGIDPNIYLYDYAPHLLRDIEKYSHLVNEHITIGEFTRAVRGKAPPKSIRFWAENERLADFLEMVREEDSYALALKYNNQGFKKFYLNEPWRDLDKEMAQLYKAGKLDGQVAWRLNRYREQVMAVYASDGDKLARSMGESFGRKFGGNEKDVILGKDFASALFSLHYLTNMGFRPYLPVRNLFQIFTTLAPRFGNDNVFKSLRYVADNTEEVLGYLRRIGEISDAPPIVNDILNAEGFLGKVTHAGLRMFKNSDDITRAVAYGTARVQWDKAVDLWKRGYIKGEKKFIRMAGLDRIDPYDRAEIIQLLRKGDPDSLSTAMDLYGGKVIRDTMFAYRGSQSPTAFHGLVGRAFGQYGTYSVNYIQNTLKGLGWGVKMPFATRLGYATRFVGNSLAIYYMMRSIGVRADNFLPWNPALFGGGPMFHYAVNAMQATSAGYQGRQARGELASLLPVRAVKNNYTGKYEWKGQVPQGFFPGSLQAKAIIKYMEYMDKGEPWLAFLALTSTPVKPRDE
jgi:hypothetical protein